jgi:ribosome-associated protein
MEEPRADETRADEANAEKPVPAVIRLDDFLKRVGVVATGGEAKIRIQSGEILVNGNVETRRRRQLRPGDQVVALGEQFVVPM